jgi:hypothetical protein
MEGMTWDRVRWVLDEELRCAYVVAFFLDVVDFLTQASEESVP